MSSPTPLTATHKAKVALSESNFGEAVDLAIQAISANPQDAEAHAVLGGAYVFSAAYLDEPKQSKRIRDGIKELHKALLLSPQNPYYLNLMAACYAFIGRSKEAIGYFKQAIEVDEEITGPYLGVVSVLVELDEMEEAQRYLDQFMETHPGQKIWVSMKSSGRPLEDQLEIEGVHVALGREDNTYTADSEDISVFGLGSSLAEALQDWITSFRLSYEAFVATDDKLSASGERHADRLRQATLSIVG